MKKKEIFLVVALVLMGLIHLAIKKGNFAVRFSDKWSPKKFALLDKEHPNTFTGAEKIYSGVTTVKLENTAGSVVVSSSDTDDVHLTTETIIYNSSKTDAEAMNRKIDLYSSVDKEVLLLSSYENREFSLKRVRIKYILKVPDAVSVEISNRFGDVTIHSTGATINSENSRGNTTVNDCSRANIFVSNKRGEIIAKDVDGKLTINGRYSPAIVKEIAGDLDIKMYHSGLNCSDIQTDTLSIEAKYESVIVNNIRSHMATIVAKKSDVSLSFLKDMGRLSMTSDGSNINLNCPPGITPDLNAEVTSGEIKISDFKKFTITEGKTRTTGVIPGDDTAITISSKYGDVFIKKQHSANSEMPVKN